MQREIDEDRDILLAFHDAALEPERWPAVLERAAAGLGARALLLLARFVPPEPRPTPGRVFGIAPTFALDYTTRLYAVDPVLPGASRLAPGATFRLRDFFPSEAALRDSRIVREWLAPQGFDDLMGVVLAPGQPYSLMLLAFTDRVGFAAAAEARLHAWTPHLQRAVRTLRKLESAGSEGALLREVVDRLGVAMLCVGHSRRALFCNRAARDLLARRDGLSVRDGHLHVAAASDRERLWIALAEAMALGGRESCATITRPSGAPPLTILNAPLETPDKLGSDELGLALMFIHDPLLCPALDPADVGILFGLTPAQARLAVLLSQGHPLEEVGQRLGLKLSTVRTRMNQIFERTGTSRQAELVKRLVLSAAALRRR